MRKIFHMTMAAGLMAFSATAIAGDADKAAKGAEHGGVMTEKMGETVPKMTSDKDAPVKETAHDAETYTGAVGENVPKMTAPETSGENADQASKK